MWMCVNAVRKRRASCASLSRRGSRTRLYQKMFFFSFYTSTSDFSLLLTASVSLAWFPHEEGRDLHPIFPNNGAFYLPSSKPAAGSFPVSHPQSTVNHSQINLYPYIVPVSRFVFSHDLQFYSHVLIVDLPIMSSMTALLPSFPYN